MTTKAAILQAIRRNCLDCCCQQPGEVRKCHLTACPLHPYKMGRDPDPNPGRGFAKTSVYADDFEEEDERR